MRQIEVSNSRFKKLSIRGSSFVEDGDDAWVFHVDDPHAMTQAAGYLKHVHGHDSDEHIFFRGQAKLYASLVPSLFRGCTTVQARGKRAAALHQRLNVAAEKNKAFNKFDPAFQEPLLQHYGFRTTWIDLVDNIWVALWFACNTAKVSGPHGEYVHFEQRKANNWNDFAYILLIGAGAQAAAACKPGFVVGKSTELVDLRTGVPSIFLRPHAQHGVLFRMRGDSVARPGDYRSQIRGVIRVNLEDALSWLGQGSLLGVHSLFPPPSYDQGYGYLLNSDLGQDHIVGGIGHIGA